MILNLLLFLFPGFGANNPSLIFDYILPMPDNTHPAQYSKHPNPLQNSSMYFLSSAMVLAKMFN